MHHNIIPSEQKQVMQLESERTEEIARLKSELAKVNEEMEEQSGYNSMVIEWFQDDVCENKHKIANLLISYLYILDRFRRLELNKHKRSGTREFYTITILIFTIILTRAYPQGDLPNSSYGKLPYASNQQQEQSTNQGMLKAMEMEIIQVTTL